MAKLHPPPQTIRVAVSGTFGAAPWANVFWCYIGGVNTPQADLDTWTSNFGEMYSTQLGPTMSTDTTIASAAATLFTGPESALHSVHPMAHAGTNAGTFINDKAMARVLSWNSTVYWRGGKPRTYLPGLVAADTTDGRTLTAAAKTNLRNQAQSFHAAINALSANNIVQTQHGFVSFYTGGTLRDPGVFFPILSGTAHGRIGSQRRRLGPWVP